MKDYEEGIRVEVDFSLKQDNIRNRHYLEVCNNIARDTVRMYYHVLEEQYVKNMPNDTLLKTASNLQKEILERRRDGRIIDHNL